MFRYWTTENSPEFFPWPALLLGWGNSASPFDLSSPRSVKKFTQKIISGLLFSLPWFESFQGASFLHLFRKEASSTRTVVSGESALLQEGAVLRKELHLSGGKHWGKFFFRHLVEDRKGSEDLEGTVPSPQQWVEQGLWVIDSLLWGWQVIDGISLWPHLLFWMSSSF